MGAAHTSEASSNISQAQIDVKEFSPFFRNLPSSNINGSDINNRLIKLDDV